MIKLDYDQRYNKGRIITDENTLKKISYNFSVPVENIEIIRRRTGNPNIPNRNYAIKPTGLFDFGLYQNIINFLDDSKLEYQTTENFNNQRSCGFRVETVFDGLDLKHRDYGVTAVSNALESGCGTIVSATGSGKSFLTASLLENIKRTDKFTPFKCLIIVPGLSLVDQLIGDFKDYGVSFTFSGWTGKMELQDTEIIICNSENFCSKFEKSPWIKDINVLIIDEVHRVKNGNVVTNNVSKIKSQHKYGFTGTLPKSKIDEWKIIGTLGPIIFEKKSKELRDKGFLSDAIIQMIKLNYSIPWKMNYKQELEFLYNDESRANIIKKISEKLNNNSLILVNHLEHGEKLLNHLSTIPNKTVYFVKGEMCVEDRNQIIREMEINNNIICIAMSSIFSTGINIKNLHYILFVAGGKSFIRIVQAIGRGLRLHDSKNKLTLFDIYDNLKYSMQHADERKSFYSEEEIEWKEKEINL
jgi:superfamily II DNA or RNA helicase